MLWPSPYNAKLSDKHRELFFRHLADDLSVKEGEQQFELVAGLLAWLERRSNSAMTILGICGAQGSGKSTLADQLALMLDENGVSALVLSMDDFYLTKQQRETLGKEIHPLLKTRGVPGTHDMSRMVEVIAALKSGKSASIPRFDKALDDRSKQEQLVDAPVQVLIVEGWCLGAKPQTGNELKVAVNALEREEDKNGVWRRYVNRQLESEPYQAVFAMLDLLVFIKVPEFQKVLEWRWRQEQQLGSRGMSIQQIERFVMHYERLTRHILKQLPLDADLVFNLKDDHSVETIIIK